MVTTMESSGSMFRESGVLSRRSMVESLVLHAILLALLMIVGASVMMRSGAPRTKKELDIVFYHPAAVPVAGGHGPASSGKGAGCGRTEAKTIRSSQRTWQAGICHRVRKRDFRQTRSRLSQP